MKKFSFGMVALILWLVLISMPEQTLASPTSPQAEKNAAAFYKGKTVEFVAPYTPGGAFDTLARLLAPFLAKHLGATVIVRNEPGAGSKVALNRLAKETNGLSLVTLSTKSAAVAQAYGDPGVRFDLRKFNWLATVSTEQNLIVVSKKSGYRTLPDLQNAKEVKFGTETKTSGSTMRPLLMGQVLGVNVKAVVGYKGSADIIMALIKGEVDAMSPSISGILPYINSQDVIPLLTMTHERIKLIPNTPTLYEVKKLSDKEKRMVDVGLALDAAGRVVATTPDVPRERVAFLESALKKTLEEPELLKKYEIALNESIDYVSGKKTAEATEMMLITGDEKILFGKLLGIEGY